MIVYYRSYHKNFTGPIFYKMLKTDFSLRIYHQKGDYEFLKNNFINIVNKNTPLRKKFISRNQDPFIIRKLRKEICNK